MEHPAPGSDRADFSPGTEADHQSMMKSFSKILATAREPHAADTFQEGLVNVLESRRRVRAERTLVCSAGVRKRATTKKPLKQFPSAREKEGGYTAKREMSRHICENNGQDAPTAIENDVAVAAAAGRQNRNWLEIEGGRYGEGRGLLNQGEVRRLAVALAEMKVDGEGDEGEGGCMDVDRNDGR